MAEHSDHVPKFGNWDSENVPYTAYFEHARREKGGMRNPNDPMENPEAFNTCMRVDQVMNNNGSHTPQRHVRRRSSTQQSSHFDHKRNMSKGGGNTSIKSFSSSSHSNSTHKSRNSSFNDHANHQGTAIPKFGTWDVTNPKSGDGYTAIFSKIKEEKQINSSRHVSSTSTTPLPNNSNIQNQYGGSSSWFSKYCCCCFQAKANEREI